MGKRDKGSAAKVTALVVIGLLTSLYSLAEIAAALYFHSLALLSDGFHNLSDVIALLIAFWALRVRHVPRAFLFQNLTSSYPRSSPMDLKFLSDLL